MQSDNKKQEIQIPIQEIERQKEYVHLVKSILDIRYETRTPKAYVHTYGCQGNVSDSERMKGTLSSMGYKFCDSAEEADFVLFNTCAVREHAEDRVFGNVGALKNIKAKKPDMIIGLCGCMMQQEHVAEKIKRSYPFVNLVFGTYAIHRLPELLYNVISKKGRVFEITEQEGKIAEGIPVWRDSSFRGWLPVMYGCDNYCSYCIVPYVRGRERSRKKEDILNEAKELVDSGVKEITLLGQNVNSYGNQSQDKTNFSDLLREINKLEGDFIIRFMTSHPKDCTYELLDTMAECEKVAKHLHLPFQSGNNRILRAMNRGYTRESYIGLIDYAKKHMPSLSVTSDVIVGFPGETYQEFCDTLSLVEMCKFTSLFTFIYSKRTGTAASKLEDLIPYSEKSKWFRELTDLQEKIAAERSTTMINNTYRVLVESETKNSGIYTGKTQGNVSIEFPSEPGCIGKFANVKVTKARNWLLSGELV